MDAVKDWCVDGQGWEDGIAGDMGRWRDECMMQRRGMDGEVSGWKEGVVSRCTERRRERWQGVGGGSNGWMGRRGAVCLLPERTDLPLTGASALS